MTAVDDFLLDYYCSAGTGSRSVATLGMADFNRLIDQVRVYLMRLDQLGHNVAVASGGAEGWDHLITLAAVAEQVPYVLVLPNPSYGDYYWARHSVTGKDRSAVFANMINRAKAVEYVRPSHIGANGRAGHANFDRNDRLVALGQEYLVYDAGSPGTRDAVAKIKGGHPERTITTFVL